MCVLANMWFLVGFLIQLCFAQQPSVKTGFGSVIQGQYVNVDGDRYAVFRGIPYAESPTGNRRFKPPIPKQYWPSLVNAVEDGKVCPQASIMTGELWDPESQSEDCLYLNIYAPTKGNPSFPVMVWIHGGAFISGSILDYSMEETIRNLVSQGIIVVPIQYRLGALGFWSSNEAGGNFGLLDQVLALQFVQENIRAFGGDPMQVTIFGESAGAGSVSYLTISPLTRGLFSQAILMSGSAYSPWAQAQDHLHPQLAEALGCRNNLTCMQAKSTDEILNSDASIKAMGKGMWGGRVDGFFLPDTIENLMLQRSPINVMMGNTKDEMGFFELSEWKVDAEGKPRPSVRSKAELLELIRGTFATKRYYDNPPAVRAALDFRYAVEAEEKENFYTPRSAFWLNQAIQMQSSRDFVVPVYKDARNYVNSGATVYLYSFDYLNPSAFLNSDWKGVVHAADLQYLLGWGNDMELPSQITEMMGSVSTPQDKAVIRTMSSIYGNFAKTGNPNPIPSTVFTWEPLDMARLNYLSINSTPEIKEEFHHSEIQFWSGLVEKLDGLNNVCSVGKKMAGLPIFLYYTLYC